MTKQSIKATVRLFYFTDIEEQCYNKIFEKGNYELFIILKIINQFKVINIIFSLLLFLNLCYALPQPNRDTNNPPKQSHYFCPNLSVLQHQIELLGNGNSVDIIWTDKQGLNWNIAFSQKVHSPIINGFFDAVIIKDHGIVCEYSLKATNEILSVYGNFFIDHQNDALWYTADNTLICTDAINKCKFTVPAPVYANLEWPDACNQCWPSPQTALNNSCTVENCVAQGYYHCLSQNPPLKNDDSRIANLVQSGQCQYLGNKWTLTPTLPLSLPSDTKKSIKKGHEEQLNFYNKTFHTDVSDLQQMKADIIKRYKDYYANLRKCNPGTYQYAALSSIGIITITSIIHGLNNKHCDVEDSYVIPVSNKTLLKCEFQQEVLPQFTDQIAEILALGPKDKEEKSLLLPTGEIYGSQCKEIEPTSGNHATTAH